MGEAGGTLKGNMSKVILWMRSKDKFQISSGGHIGGRESSILYEAQRTIQKLWTIILNHIPFIIEIVNKIIQKEILKQVFTV